ncbi:MAG: efflux RND transporter periplasmic adaptor subunit [Candidatus Pacebacteria bacterium]|nr:efflux RND transporter periplasmic adaptor subunit [Candidatus Paceibacterota bacterium]
MLKKLLKIIKKRKIVSIIVIAVLLVGGGYSIYRIAKGGDEAVKYVTAAVEKGTIVVSVSGSGQVASVNQMDIKAKTSGDVVAVYVTPGEAVNSGQIIAQLDTSEAAKSLRDAQTSLETAKLELDELLQPADELTMFQAENALSQAENSRQTAADDLSRDYDDGFNAVANVFLSLPTVMSGMNEILYGHAYSDTQSNLAYYADAAENYDKNAGKYKEAALETYQKARLEYDKNFLDYKAASRFSSTSTISDLIDETYETTKSIAEMVKSANNLIQFYQDKLSERNLKPSSTSNTHITSINSYSATANSAISSLLSAQRSISDSIEAIASAERSIEEKTLSLAKVKSGADELSVRAKKIAIQQKEDSLVTAQEALANCSVRAPFGGIIVKVGVEKGDSVSSGTVAATLVTEQKVAEISLNEVDAASVETGQKVTLTFDAVDGLSVAGEVVEVDSLGTVSQGVVTYDVKIAFDAQDDRVKSGMSVSAAIITKVKQNVLLVPNSAVKSSSGQSYVEMPNEASSGELSRQIVEIGLSNDSFTEIVSGLNESDQVVTQTITSGSSQKAQAQQSSAVRIPGISGGGFR